MTFEDCSSWSIYVYDRVFAGEMKCFYVSQKPMPKTMFGTITLGDEKCENAIAMIMEFYLHNFKCRKIQSQQSAVEVRVPPRKQS